MRQPILLVALFLALTVTAVSQQKQPPASGREKIEKERAEHFKKVAAPMLAEAEQSKAIIRDLIDTCSKCRKLDDAHIDATGDAAKEARISRERDQCYMVLEAKLARTHLEILAPYTVAIKGADVELAKWRAMMNICDAYEYGVEQAKKAADKQP